MMFAPHDATEIVLAGVAVAMEASGIELDLIEEADFEELPPFGVSVGCEEADFAQGDNPPAVCVATVNVFAARETSPGIQEGWVRQLLAAVQNADEVAAAMAEKAGELGWGILRARVAAQRQEVSQGVRSMKTDLEITLEAKEIDESDSGSESK